VAIWQFTFHLRPKDIEQTRIAPDDPASWFEPNPDFHKTFNAIFPRSRSWSPKIDRWGSDMDIVVELWHHDNGFVSLRVRIHAGYFKIDNLRQFLEAVETIGMIIVLSDYRLIEPSMAEVLLEMRQSPTGRFVENPQQYIESLRDSPITE
jgi:hypothetical protein